MATAERRIVLLGNTGNGKSSTGNSLLGTYEFAECRSPQPETQCCQFRKHFNDKRQMSYTIVDTPGFMCADGNLAEHLLEIQKSIVICPEPHAFVLVFSPFSLLSEDEDSIFDLLRVVFGEKIFKHCLVVFTHGEFFRTDEEFTQYWQTSNMLVRLVDKCGGRIIRIENERSAVLSQDYVNRIYDTVEKMSSSGKIMYSCETLQKHKNVLQKYSSGDMHQMSSLLQELDFEEMKEPSKRRIILIGKTGSGKSSTGNSLLGQQAAFKQENSLRAVTQSCLLRKRYCSEKNLIYAVLDTPGLMDKETTLAKRLLEIHDALEHCPDPHVFLLVFSSASRMTQEEVYTMHMLRVMFGKKVFAHSIVVFTGGSKFSTDEEFEKYWTKSELLVDYVKRCGGRIARIENKDSLDIVSNKDVQRIYDLIDQISVSGKRTYHCEDIKTHKKVLENHRKNYKGKPDIPNQLSALSKSLEEGLSFGIPEAIVVGSAIVAVGLLAALR